MIELKNITKKIGAITHVKPTTLILEPGHFNVLLGETGAGKTSLIKLMAGLDRAASGQIFIDGEDMTRASTRRRNISLVHQFFVNYPHMTVFENIASPLRVAGMAKDEIAARVEEAADLLQLRPMLNRRPQELSGGQQQRTALARAIAKEARAVFLDEPLANLDYKLREELREQLPALFAGRGAVVVYATSEPEEALLLGGRTGLMRDGEVVQFGPTAQIYRTPGSLDAARVFSDPPINEATVQKRGDMMWMGDKISWPLFDEAAGLTDGPYRVAIHPHHVSPTEPDEMSIAFRGMVRITELSGSESVAHFELGADPEAPLWVSLAPGVHPYRVGESHEFHMIPGHCLYFAPDGTLAARGRTHG